MKIATRSAFTNYGQGPCRYVSGQQCSKVCHTIMRCCGLPSFDAKAQAAAGANILQQQAKFDVFIEEFNHEHCPFAASAAVSNSPPPVLPF
jgi:hypothetical protein